MPLASTHAVAAPSTTPSASPSVNSTDASSEGAQGVGVSRGESRTVVPSASIDPGNDPQLGVHKPSDDTRVNSGAGDAIPLNGAGSGVP